MSKVTAAAAILAAQQGGVPYGYLLEGERFMFPGSTTVYLKTKGGWYTTPITNGARSKRAHYRTGANTTVLRVEE